jgi:hypothetical protein
MLAWENSGFSVDAFRPDHAHRPRRAELFSESATSSPILRSAPFALERLSVIRGPDGRITRIRSVLPRHNAAN